MTNINQKIFGSMNYGTYTTIQNAIFLGGVGMTAANYLTIQEPAINTAVTIAYIYNTYTLVGVCSHYTEDVTQVNGLYNEYIKNYNKLNKMFDFDDPVQVYAMFKYLLYKGYITVDRKFEFDTKIARDIPSILGTNIIAGTGVCRHISNMLTDILKNYGMNASNIVVYSPEEHYKSITKLAYTLVGNHMITLANKDNKEYFLDPTQERILLKSENRKELVDDKGKFSIAKICLPTLGRIGNFANMKKELKKNYDSISLEETKNTVKSVEDLCSKNLDIFENFYNENHELSEEINEKLMNIPKRKFLSLK